MKMMLMIMMTMFKEELLLLDELLITGAVRMLHVLFEKGKFHFLFAPALKYLRGLLDRLPDNKFVEDPIVVMTMMVMILISSFKDSRSKGQTEKGDFGSYTIDKERVKDSQSQIKERVKSKTVSYGNDDVVDDVVDDDVVRTSICI